MRVLYYQTVDGKVPVLAWLSGLPDVTAQGRISARLDRATAGALGDWKSVGGGVFELRMNFGPGYRVYFGRERDALILLLCGGEKRTQLRDIEIAHAYWKDYKGRGS